MPVLSHGPQEPFERLRRHIEVVTPISDGDFSRVKRHFQPRVLRRRQHLYRQGDVCAVVAFIVQGCMRNYHIREDGEEYIVNFAVEDWWVADLQSFHLGIPSMFNVQALEDCTLLTSSKPDFEAAITGIAAFGDFYRTKIGRAYTASTMRLVFERSETAEARYRKLLEAAPWALDRVPQRHLASYLGITPQSLSRIRRQLQERRNS